MASERSVRACRAAICTLGKFVMHFMRVGVKVRGEQRGNLERGRGRVAESTPARPRVHVRTCKRDSIHTLAHTHMLSESCE